MSGGSVSRNPDSVAPGGGPSGEFHSRRERDEPLTTHGHKPGVMVGNDSVPEFTAKTLPPGSAPSDSTFKPNNESEVPPVQQELKNVDADAPQASASDSIGGATSGDVNTGLGKPIQGQTSSELRHDGQHHNKNPGMGLDGLKSGAQGKTVDPHDPQFQNQRALDKDEAEVGRGNIGGPPAQEREPETSERVASENKIGRDERAYGS